MDEESQNWFLVAFMAVFRTGALIGILLQVYFAFASQKPKVQWTTVHDTPELKIHVYKGNQSMSSDIWAAGEVLTEVNVEDAMAAMKNAMTAMEEAMAAKDVEKNR